MYVVYIEELFKFIPRERIYINQLEEYSLDQVVYISVTCANAGQSMRFSVAIYFIIKYLLCYTFIIFIVWSCLLLYYLATWKH